MTNLANILTESARRHRDRPAIRLDDILITYAELDDLTARAAGWLRARGIEPGDRVAIALPNVVAFPVVYYGLLRAGATVVPMNPLLKSREIEHHLGDSGAKLALVWSTVAAEATSAAKATGTDVVVIDDDTLAAAADWPSSPAVAARDDADTAVILYTSGTTGSPKGAQLTHANLYRNAIAFTGLFDLCQNDVVLGCLPLFHAFGQSNGLNASIAVGASVSLVPRFEPTAVLRLIDRHRVTVFEGVPTMYVTLLHTDAAGVDTSSLRMCVSGGAALPVEVLNGFQETFGAPILEGYGLSETSPTAAYNRPGRTKAGSIGLPIDGVEMKLVNPDGTETPPGEPGEIVIRGHNVMKGYWKRPDATAAAIVDGWFHTGDMATRDDDGFYFIVDRNEGHDHPRRLQHLPTRNRRSALRTPRSPRSRRDRGAPRDARRRGRCRRRSTPRHLRHCRRTPRLRQGPSGRLQVPATCVVCRCAPQGADRQAPQTRNPSSHRASRSASGRGQYIYCLSCPRRPRRRQPKQLVEPTT